MKPPSPLAHDEVSVCFVVGYGRSSCSYWMLSTEDDVDRLVDMDADVFVTIDSCMIVVDSDGAR